eukprot:TRINITY_DN235_c0_g1_i4.p1 TRINITY_DN235_c0_g1~~TRINITY_DN235_c0_g1_i4.p1  ORF type:complete len:570 (-),score=129.97 TRINITY_DN235_c0_g1_i4:121-1830(-)
MKVVSVLLGLTLLVLGTEARCIGRDGGFSPANAKPVVSQPSRNDPTKVMVAWDKIVKKAECVDGYKVLVWADGMPQSTAQKIAVDKNTKSKIVDIQPCVGYRFAVEINEKGVVGGMKVKTSGEQLFKTTSAASTIKLQPNNFHVSYLWDPVKKVTDLRRATISILRDQVPGASCLDFIQVTGSQLRSSSSSRPPIGASRSRTFSWDHLLGQSNYNPQISVGGASTLPANVGSGFRRGSTSSSASTGSRRGSTSSTTSRQSSTTSMKSALSQPQYSNTLPRAKGGATKQVGPIRVQPPFINGSITIVVPVEDCAEYEFEVKFMAPRSKEVGKVSRIRLLSLADVPGYVPPPLTSVMSITWGTSGKPIYGVKTSSGVNAACLPAYFEAYDAYTHRLENEVTWLGREGNRVTSLVSNTQNQLTSSQEELLRKAGCVCTSPHLNFSSTDASLNKKYGNIMGHYQFQGMHAEHPFYKLMDHGQPVSSSSSSRPSITTPRPVPAQFLFWDKPHKQWIFAPTLGSDSGVEFGSVKPSLAKCPGDPPARDNWQYKSSVLRRWKKNVALKVTCEIRRN